MENAWHALTADRGLKMALVTAGAMLILFSADEHHWRRVLGLALTISAHWCP